MEKQDMHKAARDFMDRHSHPEWAKLSLDEWLVEHCEDLTLSVYQKGSALLREFSGYGGEN